MTNKKRTPPFREAWKETVRESAGEFLTRNSGGFPRDIRPLFYTDGGTFRGAPAVSDDLPVFSERRGWDLVIHLRQESLQALPPEVLRGWIHREAAWMQVRVEQEGAPFNFRRQFQPLFPVSGSAVGFIREIVEGLRKGLDEHLATRRLLDLGWGDPQIQFNAYRSAVQAGELVTYRDTLPHGWTRASFLCRLLPPFLAISCLASRGPVSGSGLKKIWWERHGFFIREDQALLEELAWSLEEDHEVERYSDRLIALFIPMRDVLLTRHPGPPSPPTLQ